MVLIFVDTPGRLNEIATLKVDDVHLEDEKIKVTGKGRRQRFTPVGLPGLIRVNPGVRVFLVAAKHFGK